SSPRTMTLLTIWRNRYTRSVTRSSVPYVRRANGFILCSQARQIAVYSTSPHQTGYCVPQLTPPVGLANQPYAVAVRMRVLARTSTERTSICKTQWQHQYYPQYRQAHMVPMSHERLGQQAPPVLREGQGRIAASWPLGNTSEPQQHQKGAKRNGMSRGFLPHRPLVYSRRTWAGTRR